MSSQYIPPQPLPENRSRASSTASMNKYHPDNYRSAGPLPGPPPPGPGEYPAMARPRGPSLAGQPVPIRPPIPQTQTGSYGPPPPISQMGSYSSSPPQAMVDPQGRLHPGYPIEQQPEPYPSNTDRDGYVRRPSEGQRRASASSTHSRHSQRSHHSGRSHHTDRSRRSSDHRNVERRSYERDHDRDRRHSDYKDRDSKPVKRMDSYRPSWGGTLFSMWDTIKDALGPRDKY